MTIHPYTNDATHARLLAETRNIAAAVMALIAAEADNADSVDAIY